MSSSGITLIPFSWVIENQMSSVQRGSAPTCLLSGSLGSFPQWRTQWRTSATAGCGKQTFVRSALPSYYMLSHKNLVTQVQFFTLWIYVLDVEQSGRFQPSDSARCRIWKENCQHSHWYASEWSTYELHEDILGIGSLGADIWILPKHSSVVSGPLV